MSQIPARRRFPAALPNASAPDRAGAGDDDVTDPHLMLVDPGADAARSTVLHPRMPELGPLESFMRDPDVTEILVNDTRNIMIEKDGRMTPARQVFRSLDELNRLVTRLLQGTGRMLTPESPCIDITLPDGSRVNVVGPPVTPQGPCLTIRKFPNRRLSLKELVQAGTLDPNAAQFLAACVTGRTNLVISGGTGSGKTTLLNALAAAIPAGDRVITIEETPELALAHANLVTLHARPAGGPPGPGLPARDLVANAMRMRPDRILVGECRRGEAFDMLQAMNTGHAGSMTTLHANGPRDALARLETLALLGGVELPLGALRRQISRAVDLLVHLQRGRDGRRRITAIVEVTGTEGDTVTTQEIFTRADGTRAAPPPGGAEPRLRPTGLIPTFLGRLAEQGVEVPRSWFGA